MIEVNEEGGLVEEDVDNENIEYLDVEYLIENDSNDNDSANEGGVESNVVQDSEDSQPDLTQVDLGQFLQMKEEDVAEERFSPVVARPSNIKQKKCTLCGHVTQEKGGLAKHLREAHGNGPQSVCDLCKKFVWTKLIKKHLTDMHEDESGVCPICDTLIDGLKQHNRDVHEMSKLCQFCLVEYPTDLFEQHEKELHSIRSYFCEICNREFQVQSCYKNHVKLKHMQTQMFYCGLCSFSTPYRASVNKHMTAAHAKNERYICEICAKVFYVKDNLLKHLRTTHDGKARVVCAVCGKICCANRELANHMRLHTGDLPYQCEFCTRKFPKKVSLEAHRSIHTGERHFRCTICSESFRMNSQLKVHYFREHGVEEYRSCDRSLFGKYSTEDTVKPAVKRKKRGEEKAVELADINQ